MTPPHLQARSSAAGQFLSMSLMPLSPLAGAALLHRFGGSAAMLALVVASALVALYLSSSRTIREVPHPRVWREGSPAAPESGEVVEKGELPLPAR